MSALGSPPVGATRLVIVGGGFTGAVVAMNAARIGTEPIDITMVEPASELGRGIAYGTEDPSHRINVPSDRMNLFKAEPGQATRWLHQEGFLPDSGSVAGDGYFYVPREAYGSFIVDTLRRTIAEAGARVTFRHRRALARSLVRRDDVWTVGLSDGSEQAGDLVALCFGHAVPHRPCSIDEAVAANPKFVLDPWVRDALAAIEPTDAVLVVGTGLTMADVAVSLLERGHRGPISAVSRRGLLPRPQGVFANDVDLFQGGAIPNTALGLLRLLRRRIRRDGPRLGGWQPLVDALRLELPRVWGGLTSREKKRVLRRLLPFWEVHRFRIAPQVATALNVSMQTSALRIEKAGLTGLARRDNRFVATLRHADGATASRAFDAVVLCTGPEKDLRGNPLIAALLDQGIARLDDLDLGLAVDRHSHVLDCEGKAWADLLAFGPMTRGCFGEMTGAPDIAAHLEAQAERLFGRHHQGADPP